MLDEITTMFDDTFLPLCSSNRLSQDRNQTPKEGVTG
jgi:hypothetical protein